MKLPNRWYYKIAPSPVQEPSTPSVVDSKINEIMGSCRLVLIEIKSTSTERDNVDKFRATPNH